MAKTIKENLATKDLRQRLTIVGIGASAGGIEALREFFDALPGDLGLAFVVVVHLSPHHESELAAILSRRTSMDVVDAEAPRRVAAE